MFTPNAYKCLHIYIHTPYKPQQNNKNIQYAKKRKV